jgi:putative endonuclease
MSTRMRGSKRTGSLASLIYNNQVGSKMDKRGTRKMYHVYILECGDGSLYTGWTTDPQRRLKQHNSGKGAKCTRARLPVVLRYLESYDSRAEAMQREYSIKRLPREEKMKLIKKQLSPEMMKCLIFRKKM